MRGKGTALPSLRHQLRMKFPTNMFLHRLESCTELSKIFLNLSFDTRTWHPSILLCFLAAGGPVAWHGLPIKRWLCDLREKWMPLTQVEIHFYQSFCISSVPYWSSQPIDENLRFTSIFAEVFTLLSVRLVEEAIPTLYHIHFLPISVNFIASVCAFDESQGNEMLLVATRCVALVVVLVENLIFRSRSETQVSFLRGGCGCLGVR